MVKGGKEKIAKDHDLDGKRPTTPMIPLCAAVAAAMSFLFILFLLTMLLQLGISDGFWSMTVIMENHPCNKS
jgi:hypothetical protein